MEPDNVVVRHLTHDDHFILKLVHHSLGRESLDNLYSDSSVVNLCPIHLSILACKRIMNKSVSVIHRN